MTMRCIRSLFIGSVIFSCLTNSRPAGAQVTIDFAQITCRQYAFQEVLPGPMIGAWMSGYFAGKQGRTTVSGQDFKTNQDTVGSFCAKADNFNVPLMRAIETVLGTR